MKKMYIKKRAIITIILTIAITLLLLSLTDCLNNKCLIVISIFLSFLFFYKIFDYIANFKTIENKSRIDIIFLFIFFIWLFIPMSHIKNRSQIYLDSRPSAKFKGIFIENNINYNFGKDFDNFFEDRFFLKDDLIKFYNQVSIALLGKYIDKDWLYRGSYKSQKYDSNNFENLVKFNTFCASHNIKLYVLIVPNKNDVYLPKKFGVLINKSQKNLYEEVNKYKNKLSIIYPYDELMMNKNKQFMFYKTEHHWTDDGAFIGYNSLMNEINKDFKDVKPVNQNDYIFFKNNLIRGEFDRRFDYGTTCSYIGLSKKQFPKYHKTKYRYYKHKKYNQLKCNINDSYFRREKLFYYPKGADKRVILLGTSQSESLCEFIPFTFKNVKRIRNNSILGIPYKDEFKIMKYYKSEILEYKPDILIFCITAGNIKYLNSIFEME